MNIYQRIHDNLVNSHRHLKESWKPGSLLERHRIVPAHQGGTYEDSNCTYLTRREHIIAHWLLWKIHRNAADRKAYAMMAGEPTGRPPRLGCKNTKEHRLNLSEAGLKYNRERKCSHPMTGRPKSEETRRKLSEALSGRVGTNKGWKPTLETRKRMSEARKLWHAKKRAIDN